METEIVQKVLSNTYFCKLCDYTTSCKSNFNKHKTTRKHQMETHGNPKSTKQKTGSKNTKKTPKKTGKNEDIDVTTFICEFCTKRYFSKSGFWKHRQRCGLTYVNHTKPEHTVESNSDDINYKNLCIEVINQNKELQKTIQELIPKVGNNNTINNTTNNEINMNFILNEYCTDAINIMDFVNSLQLQVEDLENTRSNGFVDAITSIFVNGLRQLEVNKRPIQCGDIKNDILYVRDNDQWGKHDSNNNDSVKHAVQQVKHNNFLQLKSWEQENPEYTNSNHHKNSEYLQIVAECIGGQDEKEQTRNIDKIIKNVAREVYVKSEDEFK
uniref:C2H2-type domain-containing protein n=1 Tax=viral metagenome TaxID=1070528 RepID=A0A6C0JAH0_9ZZZZ